MNARRKTLLELLRDEDPRVCASASEALDRLDLMEGLPELRGRLRTLNKVDWLRLLRSMVGIRDLGCLKLAIGCLQHPEEEVRLAALEVAEAYSDWRASPSIAGRLSDSSPLVRARAARVLGNLGDRRRAEDLRPLLEDPEPSVAASAAEALGLLAEGGWESLLLPLASHSDPLVRAAVARALGRMGITSAPETGRQGPPGGKGG